MFRYTEFDDLEIIGGDDIDDVGTLLSFPSVVATTDGFFNFRGNDKAPPRPTVIPVRRTLTSENCATFGNVYRDWRAKRGDYGRLWRTWLDDGRREWIWARLEHIPANRILRDFDTLPVTFRFELSGTTWNGYPWGRYAYPSSLNDDFDPEFPENVLRANSFAFSTNSVGVVIANEGNTVARNVIVTVVIASQSSAATSLTVNNTTLSSGFSINTTIPVNQLWRIDGGAKTARNLTTDANLYPYFSYTTPATSHYFLPLAPGNNTIVVSTPGFVGSGTITFSYYDAFE